MLEALQNVAPGSLSFWGIVTGLAIADSFNPCMISVMVMMVASLIGLKLERKAVVWRAILYTAVCYATYFALGLLLFFGISYLGFLSTATLGFDLLKWAILVLLLGAGILNIIDAVKGKATLAIPESVKPRILSLMRYVSLGAVVLLALFVTIVELPCTGIFYMGLISYLRELGMDFVGILPVLAYYNVLFVAPLIGITIAVALGTRAEKLSEFHKKHRRKMRLIEGVAMILLGLLILLLG